MAARMQHLLFDPIYSDALFPVPVINSALKEVNAPMLEVTAPFEAKQVALIALEKFGFNLWRLPYAGQFAKMAEAGEWSLKDSQKYIIDTIIDTIIFMSEVLGKEELKREYRDLECDVRSLRFLYTTARRKEGERRKKYELVLVPHFEKLDAALSDLRSRIAPSHLLKVEKRKSIPFGNAIEMAKKEVAKKGSEKETGEEVAREMSDDAARESMMAIATKATELLRKGKGEEVAKALASALKALERIENPPPEEEAEKKRYVVDPATTKWVTDHLHAKKGMLTSPMVVEEAFTSMMKRRGVMKPDGRVKIAQVVRDLGFTIGSKRAIIDCELVDDSTPR
jgi:hypothetical protein